MVTHDRRPERKGPCHIRDPTRTGDIISRVAEDCQRRGCHVDAKLLQSMIKEVTSELESAMTAHAEASQEQERLDVRKQQLENLKSEYLQRANELRPHLEWLESEFASAPAETPREPLYEVIQEMLSHDRNLTRDHVIAKLNPGYFPEGINSRTKQSISMYMTHALKRLGFKPSSSAPVGTGDLGILSPALHRDSPEEK